MSAMSQTIYNGTEENLLMWDRILDIVIVKAMPICATVPLSIFSIFKYIFSDLGDEAFVLPVETW